MTPPAWPALPDVVRVRVVLFTYDGHCHADAAVYAASLSAQVHDLPRAAVQFTYVEGYPTCRMRNAALKASLEVGDHFALLLDNDLKVDLNVGREPGAESFLPAALTFALAHDGPCVVAAPYCSAPPAQRVLVMKWAERIPDMPDANGMLLDCYTRDEAAERTGFERVGALATGCMLVDLRALAVLPPPWFAYEYDDPPYNTQLASTEDTVFSRNLDWLGVPQYVAWNSWAGHRKSYLCLKPRRSPVDRLPDSVRKAWEKGWRPRGPNA